MRVEIKNLRVKVSKKEILKDVNLVMNGGEVHAIMGPNGSGKTTFGYALAGHPHYKTYGNIIVDGVDITSMPPDERSRRGIFLSFQNPPFLEGITILQLLRKSYFSLNNIKGNDIEEYKKLREKINKSLSILNLDESFLRREVNKNFSGGEKKKAEILQMLVLEPRFVIIDEVDSGLDVDSLRLVASAISSMKSSERIFLIITHYNRILNYVKPNFVHIVKDGSITRSGDSSLAKYIEEHGYDF